MNAVYTREFVKLPGHYPNSTFALKFSPVNNILVSSGNDRALKVWNYQTLEEIRTLELAHKASIESLDISPDGKTLISAGMDGVIKVWDLQSLSVIQKWIAHKDFIRTVKFYNNGKCACSCSWDKYIKLWDLRDYKCIESIPSHPSWINTIDLSTATNEIPFLASAGEDGTIKIWDLAFAHSHAPYRVLDANEGHKASIFNLCFSPDGKYLASCAQDQTIILWDAKTFKKVCTMLAFGVVRCLDFSPDSRYLVSGHMNKIIKLWSVRSLELCNQTSTCIQIVDNHPESFVEKDGCIFNIKFSPDGKVIALATMKDYLSMIPLHSPANIKIGDNPIQLL